jgi:Uncharacterized protein conserved in bacteria
MVIAVAKITVHLPECHSLKEKRQVIKSIMARVRNQFELAVAEVGENERWQLTDIGLSYVSNDGQHASEVLEHVRRYIEETRPDIVISNYETEVIHW